MDYPPALNLATEDEYRQHYEDNYCRAPITTFDGIPVYFSKNRFEHAFFESSKKNKQKDVFSQVRAKRMNWIKPALEDKNAELYIGWDSVRRCYRDSFRVAVVVRNFIVIIRFDKTRSKAFFVTAFVANSGTTLKSIKESPAWK